MEKIALELKNVGVAYGDKQVVKNVSMKFPQNQISALIGASGSGKSTLLRSINRMNDDLATVTGEIILTIPKSMFIVFADKLEWSFSSLLLFQCQFMIM